jgi:hypothetical protein
VVAAWVGTAAEGAVTTRSSRSVGVVVSRAVGAGLATGVVETEVAGVVVVVEEVVGVAALVGAGTSSSESRNLASAFRACSGNGPDLVLAQCSSMRASCVLIFSTVFKSSSVSASNAAGFVCAGVVVVEVVVGVEVVVEVGIFGEATASRITNAVMVWTWFIVISREMGLF